MAQCGGLGICGEPVSNAPTVHATLHRSGRVDVSPVCVSASQATCAIRLPLCPVRVEADGGEETLRYRAADMVEGRLYRVTWYGERYALRRSGDGVEILKFYPDGG